MHTGVPEGGLTLTAKLPFLPKETYNTHSQLLSIEVLWEDMQQMCLLTLHNMTQHDITTRHDNMTQHNITW